MMTSMYLKDQVAIVTGVDIGVGAKIAHTLAEYGATIIVTYYIKKEIALAAVRDIIACGNQAIALHLDLLNPQSIHHLFDEAIRQFGRIDILVNNARIHRSSAFLEVTEADCDLAFNVNLKGTFLCCQRAAYEMIARGGGGRIISISSIGNMLDIEQNLMSETAKTKREDHVLYYTCAGGINELTMSLAVKLAAYNITVNALAPKPSEDDELPFDGDQIDEETSFLETLIPTYKKTPRDMSYLVAYLASPEMSYATGRIMLAEDAATE